MTVQAAIFDVDGTLVDTVDLHAHAWQDAFAKWGKEVPLLDVRQQIGKGGDQLLPVFFSKAEIKRFGDEMSEWRGEHFKRVYLPQAKAFPETRALIQALRDQGIKIALASSAKKDELDVYEKLADVADLVDASTDADDVQKTKPHPDIFAVALEKLGINDPSTAIAIGDSPFDAEAAGKVGLKTIGVLCGGFPEEVLRAAGCVEIFRDPADLLRNLERITSLNHQSSSRREAMANQNMQNQQNQNTSSSGSQGGKIDNVLYDVVTVLHEKSKGLEAYDKYDRDLQGRNEIKQIFDEIRRNDEQAVQRLQDCLRQLVGGQSGQQNKAA